MAKLKIIIGILLIVIIVASVFGAYQMEIGPFEEDDDDDDNGGNGPAVDNKPIAIPQANTSRADENEPIMFNGSASYGKVANISTYEWNFDDGTTHDNVSAEHSFLEAGVYNVTLRVTDVLGNYNTTSIIIKITYRYHQDGTINTGMISFSWEVVTVENNIEDLDNNNITLSIWTEEDDKWNVTFENGWQDVQYEEYYTDTNITVTTWVWKLEINDEGFYGSIDYDVDVVLLY